MDTYINGSLYILSLKNNNYFILTISKIYSQKKKYSTVGHSVNSIKNLIFTLTFMTLDNYFHLIINHTE